MGLEPTRCDHHKILSLARLPIPTLPRTNEIITKNIGEVNTKFEITGKLKTMLNQREIGRKRKIPGAAGRKKAEKCIDIWGGL